MTELPLDDRRWLQFVRAAPGATAFHHPAWARLLADSYGYRPFVLGVTGETEILAGLPVVEVAAPFGARKWVALPFTDSCPPLAGPAAPPDLAPMLEATRAQAGIARLEVRDGIEASGVHRHSSAVIHRLALQADEDAVFRQFSRSQVQRNIRRAEREGIRIRRGTVRSDLDDVLYGLHVETRRRQGVPVQPRRFFSLLWDHVLAQDLGFVAIAYLGDVAVAGAVFLTWNGTIIYKYGASKPRYWGSRPNHLLFWDTIRWSCAHGYHTLDFGRTDADNAGLRTFKSGWGAEEEPLVYSVLGDQPSSASAGRLSSVMQPVIRKAPMWFSRLLGELFYKYAA